MITSPSVTIRVAEATRAKLNAIATSTGRPVAEVVAEALATLERRLFFEDVNRRYAELRRDPEAWAEVEAERESEETTLRDNA